MPPFATTNSYTTYLFLYNFLRHRNTQWFLGFLDLGCSLRFEPAVAQVFSSWIHEFHRISLVKPQDFFARCQESDSVLEQQKVMGKSQVNRFLYPIGSMIYYTYIYHKDHLDVGINHIASYGVCVVPFFGTAAVHANFKSKLTLPLLNHQSLHVWNGISL